MISFARSIILLLLRAHDNLIVRSFYYVFVIAFDFGFRLKASKNTMPNDPHPKAPPPEDSSILACVVSLVGSIVGAGEVVGSAETTTTGSCVGSGVGTCIGSGVGT